MYCYKCGHQVLDEAAFCTACGTNLQREVKKEQSAGPFSEIESNLHVQQRQQATLSYAPQFPFGAAAPQVILNKPLPAPKPVDKVQPIWLVAILLCPILALVAYYVSKEAPIARRAYKICGFVSLGIWGFYTLLMIIFNVVGLALFYDILTVLNFWL